MPASRSLFAQVICSASVCCYVLHSIAVHSSVATSSPLHTSLLPHTRPHKRQRQQTIKSHTRSTMNSPIRSRWQFVFLLSTSIGLIGSPIGAVSTAVSVAIAEHGAGVQQLYTAYQHIVHDDVDRVVANVYASVHSTHAEVRRLYGLAEDQLRRTVRKALEKLAPDAPQRADVRRLADIEIPVYINRVNVAVDRAIDKIVHTLDTTVADIRRIFAQAELDIAAAIATDGVDVTGCGGSGGESVAHKVAQIVAAAIAEVEDTVARGQRSVQRHFFWANLIVQAYIALAENRVKKLLPLAVSVQVNGDIEKASVDIDRVEKASFAKVVAMLLEVREAFERLREFLDD